MASEVNKLAVIKAAIEANEEAVLLNDYTYTHSFAPWRFPFLRFSPSGNSNLGVQHSLIVAPQTAMVDPVELNRFMDGLVPELEPDERKGFQHSYYVGDGYQETLLDAGEQIFVEKVGECAVNANIKFSEVVGELPLEWDVGTVIPIERKIILMIDPGWGTYYGEHGDKGVVWRNTLDLTQAPEDLASPYLESIRAHKA